MNGICTALKQCTWTWKMTGMPMVSFCSTRTPWVSVWSVSDCFSLIDGFHDHRCDMKRLAVIYGSHCRHMAEFLFSSESASFTRSLVTPAVRNITIMEAVLVCSQSYKSRGSRASRVLFRFPDIGLLTASVLRGWIDAEVLEVKYSLVTRLRFLISMLAASD